MTLLEQAKSAQVTKRFRTWMIDREHFELALGWLEGEVATGQVVKALGGKRGSNTYNFLCSMMKEAYRRGIISADKTKL